MSIPAIYNLNRPQIYQNINSDFESRFIFLQYRQKHARDWLAGVNVSTFTPAILFLILISNLYQSI